MQVTRMSNKSREDVDTTEKSKWNNNDQTSFCIATVPLLLLVSECGTPSFPCYLPTRCDS
eukprot:1182184-Prorocentrum_minimum.AAC.4